MSQIELFRRHKHCIQLAVEHIGGGAQRAYSDPRRKMPATAIFDFRGICNRQITGIGDIKIIKSVMNPVIETA